MTIGCFAIKETTSQKDSIINELSVLNEKYSQTIVCLSDSVICLNEQLDYKTYKIDSLQKVIDQMKYDNPNSTSSIIAIITYGVVVLGVLILFIWVIVRQVKKDDL